MKKTTQEPFNRDTRAGKMYRLICISIPGKKTGRQHNERAAKAVVQTGERAGGLQGDRREIPAGNRPQEPGARSVPVPAAPAIIADCSAEQAAPDTAGGGAA